METLGSLIDQLSIVNIKIFKAEDIKRRFDKTDKEIADATRLTNGLNQHRNNLIKEINEMMGQSSFNNVKMYGE